MKFGSDLIIAISSITGESVNVDTDLLNDAHVRAFMSALQITPLPTTE